MQARESVRRREAGAGFNDGSRDGVERVRVPLDKGAQRLVAFRDPRPFIEKRSGLAQRSHIDGSRSKTKALEAMDVAVESCLGQVIAREVSAARVRNPDDETGRHIAGPTDRQPSREGIGGIETRDGLEGIERILDRQSEDRYAIERPAGGKNPGGRHGSERRL
jgi:hypothetical protein